MLRILGAGYPRTGTASLAEALGILGLNTLHHAPERLDLDNLSAESFGCYDDVDAVVDAPACVFYREIIERYPECQVILSVREADSWWESIKWHVNMIHASADVAHIRYANRLHSVLFGSPWPEEYLYKKRYHDHNYMVHQDLSGERLLVMDIHGGDKWGKLCEFLDVPQPSAEFPWLNRKQARYE